ncbi:hypothetical protein ABTY96_46585 [Streptomyces sp. NPDC096057]|uniref:hypothetical protein n=1 Tax=Streptomyces sp. NPDC096057 TaxID=3155543 RepID=UPI003321FA49
MGPLQWGDVPTAVGALFAGGAAWFAFQTIKSQRQQIGEQRQFIGEQLRFMAEQQQNLELERGELRAAAEDRRTAQAKRVRMVGRKAGASTDGQGASTPNDHWVVTVTNDSDAPLREVEVWFGSAYSSAEVYEWNALWNPARTRGGDRLMQLVDLIGAGRVVCFESQHYSPAAVHNNPPVVFFTDDNGARWSLTARGSLNSTAQQPGSSPPSE